MWLLFWRNMLYAAELGVNLTMTLVRTLQNASFSKTPVLLSCSCDKGQGMFCNKVNKNNLMTGITQAPATVETLSRVDLPTSGTCK